MHLLNWSSRSRLTGAIQAIQACHPGLDSTPGQPWDARGPWPPQHRSSGEERAPPLPPSPNHHWTSFLGPVKSSLLGFWHHQNGLLCPRTPSPLPKFAYRRQSPCRSRLQNWSCANNLQAARTSCANSLRSSSQRMMAISRAVFGTSAHDPSSDSGLEDRHQCSPL